MPSLNVAPEPTVLRPSDTARLAPDVWRPDTPDVWVFRYVEPTHGWRLSIATCAVPGSGALSLGGFRIAPEARTSSAGFDSDREAIGLAIGMNEKVSWSHLLGIAGPLTARETRPIVGGKCVLHPTPDARVGQPHDVALLDFAIACLHDAEARGGFFITTGQDLGHGVMSDGHTVSLNYLHARFQGSVVADTSQPTGEGNFHLLVGMLRGMDVTLAGATVGLIGCGNVGTRVLDRLLESGATPLVMDSSAPRRAELSAMGIQVFAPEQKDMLLQAPIDALVVNASGGSLDPEAVAVIGTNDRLRVICGSENLVMPDSVAGADALRRARKAYAPTELGGMMGYLTAAEEYLTKVGQAAFDVAIMVAAAAQLEAPAYAATRYLRDHDFRITFEEAMKSSRGAA